MNDGIRVVLLFLVAGVLNYSIDASVCVDEYGQDIECPDFSEGVVISENYTMVDPPSIVLAKTAGDALGTERLGLSYTSAYTTGDYQVTEENVTNYNEIGSRVGAHQIMYQLKRKMSTRTVSVPTIECKTGFTINTAIGTISGPKPAFKTCHITYENETIYELEGFYYQLENRHVISDINIFIPEAGTEDIYRRGHLSDIPAMKRIINVRDYGAPYDNAHCRASAYVFCGKGDSDPWNNVVIVSDGFDPRSRIAVQEIMEDVEYTLAPGGGSFVKTLLNAGYDVVFVDQGPVGDDIVDKARSLLRVIEYICEKSTGKIGVSGYSMGGLLARVALLLGEKNDLPCMKKISKYLSIDSPHLGAQINFDFQNKMFSIKDAGLSDPVRIKIYEMIASIVYDLESTSARQLLFKHARGSLHDGFYDFLKSIGDYPKDIQLNAIGAAAWKWPYPDLDLSAGAKAATLNGTSLYIREEDLFPGTYIDLWACSYAWTSNLIVGGINVPVGSYLYDDWFGLYPEPVNTRENFPSDDHYKPTFIPLNSVFGISREDFLAIPDPENQVALNTVCSKYSPFDRIMLTDFVSRQQHIVYDDDLVDKVMRMIRKIDMTPVLQLLLD